MISLNSIYLLILFHVISNIRSQSSPGDVLGPSACGVFSTQQEVCQIPDPPIESFPNECSSFIYTSILYENNTIIDASVEGQSIKGYLDKLIQTKTSVIIEYEHPGLKEWCEAVQCNNTAAQTAEMNKLKTFLDQHKGIKGIMLISLLQQSDPPLACPDYSQNLKSYIELMKKTFPGLSIGITIPAYAEIEYYPKQELPWLDLKVLDPSVDFYMLGSEINECSDKFLKTGISPLTEGNNNTVDYVRSFIEGLGANSSKIHYRFSIFASNKDPTADMCTTLVSNFCQNSNEAKTTLCAETLQSLYEKGAYAKQYGVGFVLNSIDADDSNCYCQCGQSYPGFNALLSGYNGGPPPPPCALFDRT